ncbi:MAG: Stf0 family sulfotransferase [Allomuricauda sp.]
MPETIQPIIICMVPRSGSTYLGSLFRDNGLGDAQEYFRVAGNQFSQLVSENQLHTYGDYIEYLVENFSDGPFFSVKTDWLQFRPVYHFQAYRKYFRQAKFIYLTRHDLISQAVSRYIMDQSNYGDSTQKKDEHKFNKIQFSYEEIKKHLNLLQGIDVAWREFFALEHIKPLELQYEDLAEHPERCLSKIGQFVGHSMPTPPIISTEYKKVASRLNTDLRANFVEEYKNRQVEFCRKIEMDS